MALFMDFLKDWGSKQWEGGDRRLECDRLVSELPG